MKKGNHEKGNHEEEIFSHTGKAAIALYILYAIYNSFLIFLPSFLKAA